MSKSNRVALQTYRALLSQVRVLRQKAEDSVLTLRLPVEAEPWGHGGARSGMEHYRRAVRRYLGDLVQSQQPAYLAGLAEPTQDARCSIPTTALANAIRERFKTHRGCNSETAAAEVEKAFQALRLLSEQTHLLDCSSEHVTNGVHVEMTSTFLRKAKSNGQPSRGEGLYAFTYRGRLRNAGQEKVKLVGRSWQVFNGAGRIFHTIPKGSQGVVGCTPILKPGDSFEYHSGAVLDTLKGVMQGSFQMVVLDENNKPARHFDAVVAPFRLIAPERQVEAEEDSDEEEAMDYPHDGDEPN